MATSGATVAAIAVGVGLFLALRGRQSPPVGSTDLRVGSKFAIFVGANQVDILTVTAIDEPQPGNVIVELQGSTNYFLGNDVVLPGAVIEEGNLTTGEQIVRLSQCSC